MGYSGQRAVVTGCASGIGAALCVQLVSLGAQVHGFDVRQPADCDPAMRFSQLDLRDPLAIARAAGTIAPSVDLLFNCAGLSSVAPPMDVVRVNFIGMRSFAEAVISRMQRGGRIATVASIAGANWNNRLDTVRALVDTEDYAAADAWAAAHPDSVGAGYALSKEACIVWTMTRAARDAARGLRFNCLCPGSVATPMLHELQKQGRGHVVDAIQQPSGRPSTPAEQAGLLLFLNSDVASYVNGHALVADGGYTAALTIGETPRAAFTK